MLYYCHATVLMVNVLVQHGSSDPVRNTHTLKKKVIKIYKEKFIIKNSASNTPEVGDIAQQNWLDNKPWGRIFSFRAESNVLGYVQARKGAVN